MLENLEQFLIWLLIVVNIPLYLALGHYIFKGYGEFFLAMKESLKPKFFRSFLDGKDFPNLRFRFGVWSAVCFGAVLGEYWLIEALIKAF